jgi:hypothetical protein
MRRVTLAFGVILMTATLARTADAADPPLPPPPPPPAASTATPPPPPPPFAQTPPTVAPPLVPAAVPAGIGVLASPGTADAAWPLALAVYSRPSLRPPSLDDAHARVLCGEPPAPGAPPDVKELAETVAAVHGDDAPSRALLVDIARRVSVQRLLVVRVEGGHPSARLFLPETSTFDAAVYGPDEGTLTSWNGATVSLVRAYGPPAPPSLAAPPLATTELLVTSAPPDSRPFYLKGWFWGAVGAAAFAAGAIYFATRDNGPSSIHLTVQVP